MMKFIKDNLHIFVIAAVVISVYVWFKMSKKTVATDDNSKEKVIPAPEAATASKDETKTEE